MYLPMSFLWRKIYPAFTSTFDRLEREIIISKVLQAKLLCQFLPKELGHLHEAEFRVFSQYGEDGIIQYLISRVSLPDMLKVCVEIGCEDYREANTRLLLELNNWRAYVFDGSSDNITSVKKLESSWRLNLFSHAVHISRENIDEVLTSARVPTEVGLFSLDIDGNDYWVWERLSSVRPVFMIVEYNGLFGSKLPIAVPYRPDFNRFKAHHSGLYWGASIAALEFLGKKKGYRLIGTNSAGCNAFFVRDDWAPNLKVCGAKEAYQRSCSRDARDSEGNFTFIDFEAQQREISTLTVVQVEAGVELTVGEAIGMK